MKVICFGDSNTYGYENLSYIGGRYEADSRWVDILAKRTDWNVINEGLNGREIPRKAVGIPTDTDLFVIMLGTNDLLQGNTVSAVVERMKKFINGLGIEKRRILLIAPPPMKMGFWVESEELIRRSCQLAVEYESLAKELGVIFADAGKWQVELVFDGIHFSEKGHRNFAQGFYEYVKKAGMVS